MVTSYVLRVQREYGDDRAWLTIKLDLDLRDLFTWNTKQVRCSLPVHALQGGVGVLCACRFPASASCAQCVVSLPACPCLHKHPGYVPQKQARPS